MKQKDLSWSAVFHSSDADVKARVQRQENGAFPFVPLKVKIPLLHGDLWSIVTTIQAFILLLPGHILPSCINFRILSDTHQLCGDDASGGRNLPHQSLQCREKSSVLAIMPAGSSL